MMTDDPWGRFCTAFDEARFVDAVLALEELWLPSRDDFYKALIRISVASNQLRLGLLSSPRMLLATALELLTPYGDAHDAVDLVALRAYVRACQALIPADLETGAGSVDPTLLPRFFFGPVRPPR